MFTFYCCLLQHQVIIDVEMSLKAFHVFFISVSIALTAWFAWWGITSYRNSGDGSDLAMGIVSLIGMLLLVWYFRWFMRKLKNESYL